MRTAIPGFLAGVVLLYQQASLPPQAWSLILLFILPLLLRVRWLFRTLLMVAAGFLWASLLAHHTMNNSLPEALSGAELKLRGVIVSLPESDSLRSRFVFQIHHASSQHRELALRGKVLLAWYGKHRPALKAGQSWQLLCRVKPLHGYYNSGGVDMEALYFQRGMRFRGYVRDNPDNGQISLSSVQQRYAALRQGLNDRLVPVVEGSAFRGISEALILGERQWITAQQWQVLQKTGTSHLVAISGLHIGLLAGLVFWLVRRAWSLSAWLTLRVPPQKAAALVAILAASLYAALAGFAIPTQRALLMLVIVLYAVWRYEVVCVSNVLAVALFAVLLLDPSSVLSAGFWLSFTAVAIITYGIRGRRQVKSWTGIWRVQWLAALGLAPLTLVFFQQVSLVAPLANLLAVPLVSFILVPLQLMATLGLVLSVPGSESLFQLSGVVMQWLWTVLTWLGQLELAGWQQATPRLAVLFLAMSGVLVILLPRHVPARWTGLLLLLPLVMPDFTRPVHGEAAVHVLDVGQGLSVVVETARHVMVYDTGPRYGDFDTGRAVVIPFLRQRGWRNINQLVISHDDNDHRGGAESIRQLMPVTAILASEPDDGERPCRAGQHWEWDGVAFHVLHPSEQGTGQGRNDLSCVIQLTAKGQSLLLTGDIEKSTERRLIAVWGERLKSSVLLVPHHGSNTSSTRAFLQQVQPRFAIIPSGYLNRYRQPHPRVLVRLAETGIPWLNTADSGSLSFQLPLQPGLVPIRAQRRAEARFWHIPPVM